jgi:hypothetical protein
VEEDNIIVKWAQEDVETLYSLLIYIYIYKTRCSQRKHFSLGILFCLQTVVITCCHLSYINVCYSANETCMQQNSSRGDKW